MRKSFQMLKRATAVLCSVAVVLSTVGCGGNQGKATGGHDVTTGRWREKEETTFESVVSEEIAEESVSEVTTEESIFFEETSQMNTEQQTTTVDITEGNGTPYGTHGRLSVSCTRLVDQYGNSYSLKGVSTHGISWYPQYVSYDTFKELRDTWGANVVRIALYTAEYNGYCSGGNKEELKALVKKGIDAATELGLYVIVDWHILTDTNPWQNKEEAVKFFSEISEQYKNYDNVIYEICNEPNGGTTWADIKSYAMEVIPVIRANDSDAIIIVGTPNWSQDVEQASYDKITGYDNVMYALHFYAATHKQWLRDKAQIAINNGCPLFVSEFSICDASGNGALDINEANMWLDFLDDNGISYVGWNLSNKEEASALFQSWCSKISGFEQSELSEWAKWLKLAIQE